MSTLGFLPRTPGEREGPVRFPSRQTDVSPVSGRTNTHRATESSSVTDRAITYTLRNRNLQSRNRQGPGHGDFWVRQDLPGG